MKYKAFFTNERLKELASFIEAAGGSHNKGLEEFAQKYGLNFYGLRTYFYQQIQKSPMVLHRKDNGLVWSLEMMNELIETVGQSKSRREGCKKFAEKHGINTGTLVNQFARFLRFNPDIAASLPNSRKAPPVIDQRPCAIPVGIMEKINALDTESELLQDQIWELRNIDLQAIEDLNGQVDELQKQLEEALTLLAASRKVSVSALQMLQRR
jgi:hypothetical protein